jgi:hypothetical protein
VSAAREGWFSAGQVLVGVLFERAALGDGRAVFDLEAVGASEEPPEPEEVEGRPETRSATCAPGSATREARG